MYPQTDRGISPDIVTEKWKNVVNLHVVRAVLMGTKSCTKILIFSTRFSCENHFRAKILPSKIS